MKTIDRVLVLVVLAQMCGCSDHKNTESAAPISSFLNEEDNPKDTRRIVLNDEMSVYINQAKDSETAQVMISRNGKVVVSFRAISKRNDIALAVNNIPTLWVSVEKDDNLPEKVDLVMREVIDNAGKKKRILYDDTGQIMTLSKLLEPANKTN